MEYIRTILAKNLLNLRLSTNLNKKQLAQLMGVNYSGYVRWETGVNWPDPESIEIIASYYKVPSSRLFHDPDLDLSSTPVSKTPSFNDKLALLDPLTREHIEFLVDGLLPKK